MSLKLTHWQYSFHLYTHNLSDSVRADTNPFTGEAVESHFDDGLTNDEIDAVRFVFLKYGIEGPEPYGEGYARYNEDGESLRCRCGELDCSERIVGISVELVVRQLSDDMLAIVLEIARAGNLVLMSSFGDCVRVVDRDLDSMTLRRWPDAQVISSVDELRHWLEDAVRGFRVHVSR